MDQETDDINEKLKAYGPEAIKILRDSNPIDFFVEAMSQKHLGDNWIKKLLFLATFSPYVQKPDEYIHAQLNGSAGRGKSSIVKTFLSLLPDEIVIYLSGFSPKYLLYLAKNNPKALNKKIVYVDDDILMETEFIRSIKTPNSDGKITYGTVIDQNATPLILDGAPVVFESKVVAPLDDQERSRSIIAVVDESEEHKKMVRDFIIKNRCNPGSIKKIESLDQQCKTIYRILIKQGVVDVIVPDDISSRIPEYLDPRQIVRFIGLIKCSAFANQFRRERKATMLVAVEEDFQTAMEIFTNSLGSDVLGLDTVDANILVALYKCGNMDYVSLGYTIAKTSVTANSHCKRLMKFGFIHIIHDGRKDIVQLSLKGNNALKILEQYNKVYLNPESVEINILNDDEKFRA